MATVRSFFVFGVVALQIFACPQIQGQEQLQQWDVVDGEKGLGIVRDWPNLPPKFEIPDYLMLAKAYENMAFIEEDDRTHRWAWGLSPSFRGLSMLQPSYFLHNWWRDICYNQPKHCSRSVPNYYSESLVILPGLLSSTLIGSDMTRMRVKAPKQFNPSRPKNLVRMVKAYYHADRQKTPGNAENGGFKNHFPDYVGGGGFEFWFQLLPNVYAMQLLSRYSQTQVESYDPGLREPRAGEPSFDELARRSVETFYRMEQFLKGGNSVPNFEFSGVELKNGGFEAWDLDCSDNRGAGINLAKDSPNIKCAGKPAKAPAKYQSDAAGSFALLGVMAYDRWNDPKYLAMADESLRFLLKYDPNFNPVFEVQFNYGVLAAARMNRQYGYDYDIKRFMQWAFSRSNKKNIDPSPKRIDTWPNYLSNNRPEVGIINEMWGEFPVYGLWGGKSPWSRGGYAFYMNSIQQAVTLAPVAKYYPQYATLFGKYLLHVASNSKAFFPTYMPNNQHQLTARRLAEIVKSSPKSQYHLLPYEGLLRDAARGAIATGDAADAKDEQNKPVPWAGTNLSFYSGALTGLFAGLMKKTDVPEIPLWDLNATDFQSPKSYPTYLAYNPTGERKKVTVKRSDIKSTYAISVSEKDYCAVWDSVSHRWLEGTSGDIQISLEPGQAGVFSIVPGSHIARVENGQVKVFAPSNPEQLMAVIDYQMP